MTGSFLLLGSLLVGQQNVFCHRLMGNSLGWSQVVDLDVHGNMLGMKDVFRTNGIISPEPFVILDDDESGLKIPPGFTTVNPFRLSDRLRLVGYAARRPHPQGHAQACIWDLANGSVELLPKPEGVLATIAFDISSDGRSVVGYVINRDRREMKPCVWFQPKDEWIPSILDTPNPMNPLLLGGKVVISDDGKLISACLAVNRPADGLSYRSHLFLWTRDADQSWTRKRIFEGPVYQANINNSGQIVGYVKRDRQRRACVFDLNSGLNIFEPMRGDVRCEATDINNNGVVVGWSDAPVGKTGGATAVMIRHGKLKPVSIPADTRFSLLSCINDHGIAGGYAMPEFDATQPEHARAWITNVSNQP